MSDPDLNDMADLLQEDVEENYNELLERPGIKVWIRGFEESPIPLLIINTDQLLIWGNKKFTMLYGDFNQFSSWSLKQFFYESLKNETGMELTKAISSPIGGYSWRSRVERKGDDGSIIISNMLILPAFNNPGDTHSPSAYACILDNISNEYKQMLKMTFFSLLEASRLKDNDTGNHIKRVNHYSHFLARLLTKSRYKSFIDKDFVEDIGFLAAMHDVGKIGTPDDILNKKGPLEKWEREVMEEHTINGAFILSTYPNSMAKEIALHHHEKWDGSGYPYGFNGELIPLPARIVALADVYDALRMKRCYKEEFSHEKAKGIILEGSGKHFDPLIIKAFQARDQKFDEIFESLRDEP